MNILDTVVRQDYCCNCGMCAAVCPRRQLQMKETQLGEYHPAATGQCAESCRLCLQVCPFSNEHGGTKTASARNCSARIRPACIMRRWAGSATLSWAASPMRPGDWKPPPAALTTAVLCQLLKLKRIDAAIVLQPLDRRPWFHSVSRPRANRRFWFPGFGLSRRSFRQGDFRRPGRAGSLIRRCRASLRGQGPSAGAKTPAGLAAPDPLYPRAHLQRLSQPAFCRSVDGLDGPLPGRLAISFQALLAHRPRLSGGIENGPIRALREDARPVRLFVDQRGRHAAEAACSATMCLPKLADATFMDAWLPEYQADKRGTSLVISRSEEISRILLDVVHLGRMRRRRHRRRTDPSRAKSGCSTGEGA